MYGYTIIQAITAALPISSADHQDSSDFPYVLSNLFFYLVLVIISCRAYLIRGQGFQVLIGIIFALLSCLSWHHASTEERSSLIALEYNAFALVLWIGASCILIAKCEKKSKRKNFSALVKSIPLKDRRINAPDVKSD